MVLGTLCGVQEGSLRITYMVEEFVLSLLLG